MRSSYPAWSDTAHSEDLLRRHRAAVNSAHLLNCCCILDRGWPRNTSATCVQHKEDKPGAVLQTVHTFSVVQAHMALRHLVFHVLRPSPSLQQRRTHTQGRIRKVDMD